MSRGSGGRGFNQLMHKEETSSVTRIAFSGSGPRFWSWRIKKVGRVLDVGWKCLYKRFQVTNKFNNKFRDAFSRVTIA